MKLSGTEIILECLKREKVKVVFGIPGAAIMPLYDMFGKVEKLPFRNILTRHEQGAIHAADGYARATGEVGVCISTSGPGATNLVTGLANAHLDSVPLVALTGQVPTNMVGNDAFQEVDITGITIPITKNNYIARKVEDLAAIIKEAFYIARSGRPGPVLVDLPKDVQLAECIFKYPDRVIRRGYKPSVKGHIKQIRLAVEKISGSTRPVIITGGGVINGNASDELQKLACKTNIPVVNTFMGAGSFPENNHLYVGMLGMYGQYLANKVTSSADLIIALGTRFDDRITGNLTQFCPNAEIIHIDIDPAEIGKNISVKIPIVGDLKNILHQMNSHIAERKNTEWLNEIREIKQGIGLNTDDNDSNLRPKYIIKCINEFFKGEAIIVTDVGQHQMWAANYCQFIHPRTFISSGGLGTMGFGLPAAIGAKIGNPKKPVICISGDGSFQMNIQELATAIYNKIPIIVILMNNGYLGMVRQLQELFCDRRYVSTSLSGNPDFVKIVEGYGGTGFRVNNKEHFSSIFKKAVELEQFVLIDCQIPQEENNFPMVQPGSSINNMIGVEES
ncbi:MAG: biosynthetic-type acetolactate synthase large subunit [Atribacterota bacterium]|nr:biosynthetic-type acetolactate synthase large subunit [Atribacterota bacterium]MDI9596886.1 biosynthetic-type acetolactate synthase large subunit [Atribacterota bacterium]